MTHELKNIISAFRAAKANSLKTVLATVVALEGSSYRRPGVRMLIREDGKMIGAVSGGCVEKEILRQAQSVFSSDKSKMMTYDGRYRLGCEGILYILIEPFEPCNHVLGIADILFQDRTQFQIVSYFRREDGENINYGSVLVLDKAEFQLRKNPPKKKFLEVFEQDMQPCLQLLIIGAEHDAVQLCTFASLTGWEVAVVASASEEKSINDFPGAAHFNSVEPEEFALETIDKNTVVVLMTHSYVRDLKYLLSLKDARPTYLGLLGPSDRRERLLGELIERHPEISDTFFDCIHGPAGLNIGAETSQEIAIAILAEILSVIRNKKPMMLKNKTGRIHN